MFTILDYLERTANRFPENIICEDQTEQIRFKDFVSSAEAVGSYLCRYKQMRRPVAIFMENSACSWVAMIGAVYSGNFYVVIDAHMPIERIKNIFRTLSPIAAVVDDTTQDSGRKLENVDILLYEDIVQTNLDKDGLISVRHSMIDTDPVFTLFTSGSSGTPKGVVINHTSIIKYMQWYIPTFGIDENTVFGNQSPFYFGISVSTMFSTMFSGATLVVIPKQYFSFPVELISFLNSKHINSVYWVASALCVIANYKALDNLSLPCMKLVQFAGEAMPTKQFNYLRTHLPKDTVYVNLYGPSEAIDTVTYYIVDRDFPDSEPIPLGKACENCGLMVLRQDDTVVTETGEVGELCIRGSFLSCGYYNDPQRTAEVFTQNPLNLAYPELIYRTGDMVRYNERGELVYVTRKDYQIKHQGYRIELGEIEAAVNSIPEVQECACIYDHEGKRIVLYFSGERLTPKALLLGVKDILPKYMMPNKFLYLERLPHNANGKIDRKLLTQKYQESRK